MLIALDGGGLCAPPDKRFGNYIFSFNLIQSLLNYDKKNHYSIYSLCPKPDDLQIFPSTDYRVLLPRMLWMKLTVSVEQFFRRSDIFLGLNQALPLYTRAKTISFSHGFSYYFFPHLYRDNFFRLSIHLGDMIKRSDAIIVSSMKVKNEMAEMFPKYKNIEVIPYGVPFDMLNSSNSKREPFFLYVGMDHPVKNIRFLKKVMNEFPKYKLYIANNEPNRQKLKELYQKATVYLTASFYESYNLPVLEALACGTPVVGLKSAVIPELSPFVNLAENKEEFIGQIKNIINSRGVKFKKETIIEQFSWKKYAEQLIKLYNN